MIKNRLILISQAEKTSDKFFATISLFLSPFSEKIANKVLTRGIVFNLPNNLRIETRKHTFSDLWMSLKTNEKEIFKTLSKYEINNAIDVGANIGRWTLFLSKIVGKNGKVYAFEPEKENFKALVENIRINDLSNVEVFEQGCYSKNTQMNMYLEFEGTGGNTIVKNRLKKDRGVEKINLVKLDDFFKKKQLGKIDFIKIDVEGAELDVLKGAKKLIKKHMPLIYFESLTDKEFNLMKDFLSDLGYNSFEEIESSNFLSSKR